MKYEIRVLDEHENGVMVDIPPEFLKNIPFSKYKNKNKARIILGTIMWCMDKADGKEYWGVGNDEKQDETVEMRELKKLLGDEL